MDLIFGVEIKQLRSFPDDRGFFREVIRSTDDIFSADKNASSPEMNFAQSNFAQWSHSKMGKNTVKAWHFHHLQIDWWYLAIGVAEVVLFDNREESPTFKKKMVFKLGDSEIDPEAMAAVVRIPQGVLHGCKVLTDFAHLFYITSQIYNPNDEGRHPFNSDVVPHSWGDEAELITSPNDRKTFIPTNSRASSSR
ncbi:MAG: dTDP-4-dehydrorhamnose 3,5-epimerase family protein [Proteobacteria bacterium]|nr:dTDP-4-dehydrorhamnose 3,5-epimerase family protein [Pseudomonadota bacterium]